MAMTTSWVEPVASSSAQMRASYWWLAVTEPWPVGNGGIYWAKASAGLHQAQLSLSHTEALYPGKKFNWASLSTLYNFSASGSSEAVEWARTRQSHLMELQQREDEVLQQWEEWTLPAAGASRPESAVEKAEQVPQSGV